jgi:hypothetical protein
MTQTASRQETRPRDSAVSTTTAPEGPATLLMRMEKLNVRQSR